MQALGNTAPSRFTLGAVQMVLIGALLSAPSIGVAADSGPNALGVPLPPTHLWGYPSVSGDLSAAVVLHWRASLGATSYSVYMGTTPGGESSTPVATVLGPTAEITELRGFTPYYFKVTAHNAKGDSLPSFEARVMTGCDVSCE